MFDKIQIAIDTFSEQTKIPVPIIYGLIVFVAIIIIDKLTGG